MFIKVIAVKCIIEEEKKILLIKESSTSSWKPGKLGLPGGKVDPKEDILQAAHREMLEETGLKVKIRGLFRIEELVEELDSEDRLVHHYILIAKRIAGKLKKNGHHSEQFQWFSKTDLKPLTLEDYTEYYYKDLLTDYLKNSTKTYPLSVIKIRNTKNDKQFSNWVKWAFAAINKP